jgi:hypothetical protein
MASRQLSRQAIFERMQQAVAKKEGFSLCKGGATEFSALFWSRFLRNPMKMSDQLRRHSGIFPSTASVIEDWLNIYERTCFDSDVLAPTFYTLQTLMLLKLRCPKTVGLTSMQRTQPAGTDPRFIESEIEKSFCYTKLLRGQRVLIVNPIASLLAGRANEATYKNVWADNAQWWRPESVQGLDIGSAIDGKVRDEFNNTQRLLQRYIEQLYELRETFDVALIGAGGYAIPMADEIKRMGKIAVVLGGHLQVVFGVLGRRWLDDPAWKAVINEHWIESPADLRPSDYRTTENGAYW